ncbi:MAG: PEP-CTERM sorting domain-containing protein [Rhodospirillaceae bacterium]|jgi:hypothetical protein|nr:PEP-CTERM sorting domain-containing protein [Rhodospirillaceae bacterium]
MYIRLFAFAIILVSVALEPPNVQAAVIEAFPSFINQRHKSDATFPLVPGTLLVASEFQPAVPDTLRETAGFDIHYDISGFSPPIEATLNFTISHLDPTKRFLDATAFSDVISSEAVFSMDIGGSVVSDIIAANVFSYLDRAVRSGASFVGFRLSGSTSAVSDTGFMYLDILPTLRIETSSVPEPTTLAILSLGLAGLGVTRRRKRVNAHTPRRCGEYGA